MARPIQGGKELSWHKHKKQWYRTVPVELDTQGKVVKKRQYFGRGQRKSDVASYNKALASYRAHMDAWQTQLMARHVAKRMQAGEPGNTRLEHWLKEHRADRVNPQISDEQLTVLENEQYHRRGAGLVHKRSSLDSEELMIARHIQSWLADEFQRLQSGAIGHLSYTSKQSGIRTFVDYCGRKHFGDPRNVETLLTGYRTFLIEQMHAKMLAGNTVNDKLKFATQFIKWCYRHRVLDELPRTLDTFSSKLKVTKGGQPLTVEQIRAVWQHANDRMKCFIALGLNCGFKNMDICTLCGSDIEHDRIVSTRSKTKAPMNYKLWPVTLALLERTRQDQNDSADTWIFRNNQGGQLSSQTLSALFKKVAKKANIVLGKTRAGNVQYATFEQLRDTSAELLKQSLLEQGRDMAIQQLFLAHKDSSTAAYYTDNDPRTMKSTRLDEELEKLRERYDLPLENTQQSSIAPAKKKTSRKRHR